MSLRGLPLLPAFLEEGGWDIFRVLVPAAEIEEDKEDKEESADTD